MSETIINQQACYYQANNDMKNAGTEGKSNQRKTSTDDLQEHFHILQHQVENYKRENDILLALSNDLTKVREKNDLIKVFSSRLRSYFEFTHAVISLIEEGNNVYFPFLLDKETHPFKEHPLFNEVLAKKYSLDDPLIRRLSFLGEQILIRLEDIINEPDLPLYVHLHHKSGIRYALITPLRNKMKLIGFVYISSAQPNIFTEEFKHILRGIAPHLSNAVTNIIINEEILQKDKDKSFLVEFSHDIASARTKNELSLSIHKSLKKLAEIKAYFIRTINDDGITLSSFMHDEEVYYKNDPLFKQLLKTKIKRNEGLTGRVLKGDVPVLLDFEEEIKQGNSDPYIEFWKELGPQRSAFQKITGVPLRVGEKELGVLWVITEHINITLLDGISAQVAVAIANIRNNEEIAQREAEKSILLSLSDEIAAMRSREDLLHVVNTRIKTLFLVEEFGIAQINEGGTTYSTFVLDVSDHQKRDADFKPVTTATYEVSDPLFSSLMRSEDPIMLDVHRLAKMPGMPAYVNFWKKTGLMLILGMRLRVGGKNVGCVFLHVDPNSAGDIKMNLLKAVCSHLSVAISNIIANEQIYKKQTEQGFLLDFSHNITRIRTKQDLQDAIFTVLDKTMKTKLAMIRVIEDDGIHMVPFMFDKTLFEKANTKIDFDKLAGDRITIEETYTAQVLASPDGVVFNVDEELKSGNSYAKLWKTTGLRNMYGLPLRVGDKNIGTIWLMADRLSPLLLKGICAQISIAIANIQANEKVLAFKKQLEFENDYLKEQIKTIYNFSEIIGDSDSMQKVYRLMSLVADSNTTILVLGETGTGKELIARALHNASPKKDKLMVKVNCAALPANLIESELFGHERGAFTGAIERRIGKFELANNSTLFLDEIGELPHEAQAKLLRVIQERELERIGGKQIIKIDTRLIAATNRNLEEEVKAGRFRADLYFRLNVFPITLPPLRDRSEDIEPLTHFFIQKYSRNTGRKIKKVVPRVIQQLRSYTWPGNVRELEHLIERSILLTTDGVLDDIYIPQNTDAEKQEQAYLLNRSLEEVERSYIIQILKRCAGKISGPGSAAEILKIPGNTLHSKLKKLGINKSDYFSSGSLN
ncbi:MAG TPA: sigma 54-interacting transcriptional regulator [Chitinophagaceae bacterium]|nr:sigma 54-interacting transcriptional regulator [Chitinophagaceae bacterium]